jgi:hypothetical protein
MGQEPGVRGPPSCASHVGWNRYRARMLGWIAESVDLESLRPHHNVVNDLVADPGKTLRLLLPSSAQNQRSSSR